MVTMLARPAATEASDLFVLREVFVEEVYRDLLPHLPPAALKVVDIGANLGSFTIWLSRSRPVAKAFCFEPDPSSFNLCRFNLANNGCGTAQVIPKAVGGIPRQVSMNCSTVQPGGNSIYGAQMTKQTVTVEVVSLAEWMNEVSDEFDVLKLDCEGAEWEILDHTPAAVFTRCGMIIAEVHPDPTGHRDVGEFPTRLTQYGFQTLRWDGHAYGLYLGKYQRRTNP
jgi:FkbM family methyltransferase